MKDEEQKKVIKEKNDEQEVKENEEEVDEVRDDGERWEGDGSGRGEG